MTKPEKSEYDPYYENYVSLVADTDIIPTLESQPKLLRDLIASLPEEMGSFAYAEGKWTLKELISHLIDGERMFAYRLLRISRGDQTPIEGFEQDGYIENSHANDRSFSDLLKELSLLREANMMFFRNLTEQDWLRIGVANNVSISVRALGYIMAGHISHHVSIIKDRYLN
jgi:hypothetical protein